ncbi:putative nicotinamide N-methyase [Desulfobaculum xiamenense]|uniref:Putative nicotinamide N-methyase n=1 Tax=Desulfobaculum xiamenense TaxID=995050 RepID=A0A846QFA5_9BACT|nr:methyltransferase [Desulfobaculum xiamenense]NJB67466.1 putative nicotinamide N-methyase [Desulfobaculum xiamenense]
MSTPLPISLDAPLDELLDCARERYQVHFEPFSAGRHTLELLQISNMTEYVEKISQADTDDDIDLPFWAKVWPASMILSHFVCVLPPRPDAEVLEIGCGVGVCGLFAAATGFRTTLTDTNPDALLFSRINALKNGLEDRVDVRQADFAADRLGKRFDYIVGSEVLYIERLHRGLVKFMLAHIKPVPHAEVIFSKNFSRKSTRFFKLVDEDFLSSERTVGCKASLDNGESEKYLCTIHRFKPRKQVG